jgi:hypothetical protein
MGYRRIENDDISSEYNTIDTKEEDEPYPIEIFGESKRIQIKKIGTYLDNEFYYYINIYKNIKSFGLPYTNWIDSPNWITELVHMFDEIEKEYQIRTK